MKMRERYVELDTDFDIDITALELMTDDIIAKLEAMWSDSLTFLLLLKYLPMHDSQKKFFLMKLSF